MQARAEATRRVILATAVELFDRLGYANVALTDLITTSGVTKGAFYYHFINREAVAAAVISDADAALHAAAMAVLTESDHRTVENFIRSVFAVADLTIEDLGVRIGVELRGGLRHISSNFDGFLRHRQLCTGAVSAGIAEGDLRADLDPDQAGHTLSAAILGSHQQCGATGENLHARLADVLKTVLPALTIPDVAEHYRNVIDRTAAQHVR